MNDKVAEGYRKNCGNEEEGSSGTFKPNEQRKNLSNLKNMQRFIEKEKFQKSGKALSVLKSLQSISKNQAWINRVKKYQEHFNLDRKHRKAYLL